MAVKVRERLVLNDLATKLAATIAGYGVAQSVAFGLEPDLKSGALVQVLSEWSDERYPLYAYHASRRHVPARVRAVLDFVKECLAALKNWPSAVQHRSHLRAQSHTQRRRVLTAKRLSAAPFRSPAMFGRWMIREAMSVPGPFASFLPFQDHVPLADEIGSVERRCGVGMR